MSDQQIDDSGVEEKSLRIWPPVDSSSVDESTLPRAKKRPPPGFVPQHGAEAAAKRADTSKQSSEAPSHKPFAVPALPKKRPPPGFQQQQQTDAEGFAVPMAKKKPPPGVLGQRVQWAPEVDKAEDVKDSEDSARFLCDFEGDDDEDDNNDDDDENLSEKKQKPKSSGGGNNLADKPKVQATWLESLLAFGTGSGKTNGEEDDEMFVSSSSYFDVASTSSSKARVFGLVSQVAQKSGPLMGDARFDPIPEGDEDEGDTLEDDLLASYGADMESLRDDDGCEKADESEDAPRPETERTYCEDDS